MKINKNHQLDKFLLIDVKHCNILIPCLKQQGDPHLPIFQLQQTTEKEKNLTVHYKSAHITKHLNIFMHPCYSGSSLGEKMFQAGGTRRKFNRGMFW